MLYNYTYDQLNRIVGMDAWKGLQISANTWNATKLDAYQEAVTYDPNGNIVTYKRHGDAARGMMDDMTYKYIYYYRDQYNMLKKGQYNPNSALPTNAVQFTNQLDHVSDAAADVNDPLLYKKYKDLKGGQQANNYEYDKIGNLIKDDKENITNIEWTVYGKISKITKNESTTTTTITYTYDPSGNRISKAVKMGAGIEKLTWYVRDASGNVMGVYEGNYSGAEIKELHKYGSSRLGILSVSNSEPYITTLNQEIKAKSIIFTQGKSFFELSNHLGNVLVTVTDKRVATFNNGVLQSLEADVVTATDYYPFVRKNRKLVFIFFQSRPKSGE